MCEYKFSQLVVIQTFLFLNIKIYLRDFFFWNESIALLRYLLRDFSLNFKNISINAKVFFSMTQIDIEFHKDAHKSR